jgi:traG/traD
VNEKLKSQIWSILSLGSGLLLFAIYQFKLFQLKQLQRELIDVTKDNFKVIPLFGFLALLSFIFYLVAKRDENTWLKKINYWVNPYFYLLGVCYFIAGIFPSILTFALFASIVPVVVKAVLVFRMQRKPYFEYIAGVTIEEDDIEQIETNPGDFVIGEIYKRNLNEDGVTPDGEDDYIASNKKAIIPLRDRFVHLLALGVTGSGKTSQSLLPMFNRDFTSDNFEFAKINVVQMGQIVLEPKGDFAKATWAIGKIKEPEKRKNYISFLFRVEEKLLNKIKQLAEKRTEYLNRLNGVPLTKEQQKELKTLEKERANEEQFKKLEIEEQINKETRYNELIGIKQGAPLTPEQEGHRILVDNSIRNLLVVKKEITNYITFDFASLNKLSTFALFRYASLLTDIIANPADIEYSWNLFKNQDPQQKRDIVMLFDPSARESLSFNPLFGPEETAVATVKETLLAFMSDSSSYFKNTAETLLQNAIKVVKRVHGDDATLLHLNDLLTNNNGRGDELLKQLGMVSTTAAKARDNKDIQDWFVTQYYAGLKGLKTGDAKIWTNTSGIRSILANLLDSRRIRKILCPEPGVGTQLDFDEILKTGDKVAISTATGLSDSIGSMLGSFLMLQLQAAIFRRTGDENTRTPVILYIDEFQDYANSEFEAVLTKGRSYVVSATMATQTLGIVGGKAGDALVQNLQSNARNVIVYPGASADDANYFVSRFGTVDEVKVKRSISKEVDRFKIDQIKTDLAIGDNVPRESISEDVRSVDKFSKSQIMYGPNFRTRGIGSNDAFGYIYYLIIIKNSPQPPSVAKIQYIPKELKEQSDELVAAYDQINRLRYGEDDEVLDNDSQEDPLQHEDSFKETTFVELNKGLTQESDPTLLSRTLEGKEQDLSEVKTDIDFSTSANVPDIGEIDVNSFFGDSDIQLPTGDEMNSFDPNTLNPDDFKDLDIKF